MSLAPLAATIDSLEQMYGPIAQPVREPFDIIIHENASYLVDDAVRMEVFRALQTEIGTDPELLLERSPGEIERVIKAGGMLAPRRAAKVIEAARLAAKIGLDEIDSAIRSDLKRARKLLKQFPGVGDPLADKILLFSNAHVCLAPDSNALRVLVRLGYGTENEKNYSKMYRSAVEATSHLFRTPEEAQRAHGILRRHGQELCRRAPRCEACPVRSVCVWYRS